GDGFPLGWVCAPPRKECAGPGRNDQQTLVLPSVLQVLGKRSTFGGNTAAIDPAPRYLAADPGAIRRGHFARYANFDAGKRAPSGRQGSFVDRGRRVLRRAAGAWCGSRSLRGAL